ncbi:hypothetical protein QSE00_18680, partial [Arenibacter sp. M-2]|uniref:hypothetical protein n=1 Tax=Arenibacter sp. M-2 TaxID=3053612 RepID=UPI002570C6C6
MKINTLHNLLSKLLIIRYLRSVAFLCAFLLLGFNGFGQSVTVSPIDGNTTEAGGTAEFDIVLDSSPTANVTIPLSSSDVSEGTISVTEVVFTTLNWNVAQTVTVTGVDDALVDGNIGYSIVTGDPSSTDGAYDAL